MNEKKVTLGEAEMKLYIELFDLQRLSDECLNDLQDRGWRVQWTRGGLKFLPPDYED
jgi:hypothetical protein